MDNSLSFLYLLLLLIGICGGLAIGSWKNLCSDCPSVAQIRTFESEQTSKLFSHDGKLLVEIGIERRTPVSLEILPRYVSEAFIAVEDKRFYQHRGIDPLGLTRAIIGVLTGRNRGGGSTITQQLARNMFEDQIGFEKRVIRKLKELQVAFDLERSYTKDEILEAYINEINYGHGWWGIQTASRNYYGKNASELDVSEAALLASIPNRPAFYSPFVNPVNAKRRRNLVLNRMAEQEFISEEDAAIYSQMPIPTERAISSDTTAPYFEEWVRQILDDRFGSKLYTAGLRIFTTLDVGMQEAAEISMNEGWDRIEGRPGFRHSKFADFQESVAIGNPQADSMEYVQGLLIALDPWTGGVRAMIGGRDFQFSKFNRATQALRQAGSGFKPFVYTAAIASRIPQTFVIADAPVVALQVDGTEWRPSNFSETFEGPMTIRTGLQKSQNIIAIKLAQEVGLESVAQTARRMGIRSEIERFPSTAIGAAEVIPLEMAEAYSSFSNEGTKVRPFPILKVEDSQGRIIWDPKPERTQVLDPLVARIMVSMLQNVVEAGTGATAVRIVAGLPTEVAAAGKTGTTNDATDVWFNGFTPNLLATVWFGMDIPQEIRPSATGGGDAAPVWGNFMRRVYYGDPNAEGSAFESPLLPIPEPWPVPQGLTQRLIDKTTGKLASTWCPQLNQTMVLFLPGTEPEEYCEIEDARRFRIPERD
jgi:penicillin-binding protein 1A